MNQTKTVHPRTNRSAMAAMLIGTALNALGTTATAQAESTQGTLRIVNDMSRYCTVCWRNARLHPDYWGDCTQEVLMRMLQRVDPLAWEQALRGDGEERREFLRHRRRQETDAANASSVNDVERRRRRFPGQHRPRQSRRA